MKVEVDANLEPSRSTPYNQNSYAVAEVVPRDVSVSAK